MTTDTEPRVAHTAQTNVIKALSQQIWGSEWIVLDEYGDTNGHLDRELAVKLIDALHEVRKLPIDQLDDAVKLDALATVLAGEPLPVYEVPGDIDGRTSTPEITELTDLLESEPVTRDFADSSTSDEVAKPEPTGKPFTGRHGTRKAFKWHQANGEEPCDECRAIAERVEPKGATTERTQRALKPIEHGTYLGAQAHMRRGLPMCDACRRAKSEYQRAARLARNPDLKPRGKARATSAQPKPAKPAKKRAGTNKARSSGARNPAQTEIAVLAVPTSWEARFHEFAIGGLFSLIPSTEEPFPQEAQERWLTFAAHVFDTLWPDS